MGFTPDAIGGGPSKELCSQAPTKGDGTLTNPQTAGVVGIGNVCPGVYGTNQGNGDAVVGESQGGNGVSGTSVSFTGVNGRSETGFGVSGSSGGKDAGVLGTGPEEGVRGVGRNGVHGVSISSTDSGVWGENQGGGYGVAGSTTSNFQPGTGVTAGVWGNNAGRGAGVKGTSTAGDGVLGFSSTDGHAGVSAINDTGGTSAFGLWARGSPAGHLKATLKSLAS